MLSNRRGNIAGFGMKTPLDTFIKENLTAELLSELAIASPGERRIKTHSRFYSLLDAITAKTGVDTSAMLREKIARILDENYQIVTGAYVELESVNDRLSKAIEILPQATSVSSLSAVRFSVGERLSLMDISTGSWVNENSLSVLSAMYCINQEWLLEGVGAASPLMSRKGLINTLLRTDGTFLKTRIEKIWFAILSDVFSSGSHIVMQIAKIDTGKEDTYAIHPLGKIAKDDVLNLAGEARCDHQEVVFYKIRPQMMMAYEYGEEPLAQVFHGAKAEYFMPSMLDQGAENV